MSGSIIDHPGRCVIFSKCGFIIIGDDIQTIEMLLVTSFGNYSRRFVTNGEFRWQNLIATTCTMEYGQPKYSIQHFALP